MNNKLRVVYMGTGGNRHLAEDIAPIILKLGMQPVIISEWDPGDIPGVEYIKWTRETWWKDLTSCDIAIAPQDPRAYSKSSIKLVQYMRAGLPCIASPMPAYLEIDNAYSVYFANTPEEWEKYLKFVRDYSVVRKDMSDWGRKRAEDYSPKAIAEKWKEVIVNEVNKNTVVLLLADNSPKLTYWARGWREAFDRAGYRVVTYQQADILEVPTYLSFYLFIELNMSIVNKIPKDIKQYRVVCWDRLRYPEGFLNSLDYRNMYLGWQGDGDWAYLCSRARKEIAEVNVPIQYPIGFIGRYEGLCPDAYGLTRYDYLKVIHGEFGGLIARDFYGDEYEKALCSCRIIFDHQVFEGMTTRAAEAMMAGKIIICNYYIEEDLKDEWTIGYSDMKYFKEIFRAWNNDKNKDAEAFGEEAQKFALKNLTYDAAVQEILGDNLFNTNVAPQTFPLSIEEIDSYKEQQETININLNKEIENINSKIDILGIPKVSVIIPSQNDNEVLNICLEHLSKSQEVNLDIIIVRSGEAELLIDAQKFSPHGIQVLNIDNLSGFTFTRAINTGAKCAIGEYLLFLNSDVFVCPNTIINMVSTIKLDKINKIWCDVNPDNFEPVHWDILCPYSNCDLGWLHNEPMKLSDGAELIPGIDLDFYNGHKEAIDKFNQGAYEWIPRDVEWVAFYCTLMRRDFFINNDMLDENMKLVFSDEEFCRRSKAKCAYVPSAFALHLGAWRRKNSEDEDPYAYHIQDGKDGVYFFSKSSKKSIVLYSGPSWEKWTPNSINTTGIGGSETCHIWVARLLAEAGHDVTSFSDCGIEKGFIKDYDGVLYRNYTDMEEHLAWAGKPDVFISVRRPDILFEKRGKVNLLWNHDTHYGDQIIPDQNIDKYIMLTQWHKNLWTQWWLKDKVPDNKYVIIPDGIDLERFQRTGQRSYAHRSRGYHPTLDSLDIIWASSPDRGLINLLEILDVWGEKAPFCLRVCYGWQNIDWCIQRGRNDLSVLKEKYIKKTKELRNKYGASCVMETGRLPQDRLAEEFSWCRFYVSPTLFTETFGITYVEAQAAGCVIITSYVGALEEVLANGSACFPSTIWRIYY